MPTLYLSPSLQEFNPYVDGGNEEYYMNLIADEMIPYLTASGIDVVRNNPEQTLSQVINDSNKGNFDLHLALHSNAAPPALAGQIQGSDFYYYANSQKSKAIAELFANNFKDIYPYPSKVKTVATTTLAELTRTKAPAILIEIAYHDNPQEAQWIRDNIGKIARNLSMSVAEYFGLEFEQPTPPKNAIVNTQSTPLNIRSQPSITSTIVTQAPKGANILVLGEDNGWYLVSYNNIRGYAKSEFIQLT